jgi:gliding motility-associatede transport system auxiliary component
MSTDPRPSFSRGRKVVVGLNVFLGLMAAFAVVVMLNYLSTRYCTRLHWGGAAASKLSPRTLRLLDSLTNTVKVIVYFDKEDDPDLYEQVLALLKEYKFASRKIELEQIDLRDPAGANLIKAKYRHGGGAEKNMVIFDAGGPSEFVRAAELSDYDYDKLLSGESQEIKRTHFKGEERFTSAIFRATHPRQLKTYFVSGHREHDPADRREQQGYSAFAEILAESNVKVATLSLLGTADVPADCNLLIIAGPSDPFLPEELDKIDRYLNQGGRMLVLFSSALTSRQTGLEKLMQKWGVAVGFDAVVDSENSQAGGVALLTSRFGSHPIVKGLLRSRLTMVLPRSLSKIPGGVATADAARVQELVYSGAQSVAATDFAGGSVRARPTDKRGEAALIVAVERGSIKGVSAERGATRLVVAGDSIFLKNDVIDYGANADFAAQTVAWLLDRTELLAGIGPRAIMDYKLTISAGELTKVRWLLLAGLPGAILLLGLVVWARRRK